MRSEEDGVLNVTELRLQGAKRSVCDSTHSIRRTTIYALGYGGRSGQGEGMRTKDAPARALGYCTASSCNKCAFPLLRAGALSFVTARGKGPLPRFRIPNPK